MATPESQALQTADEVLQIVGQLSNLLQQVNQGLVLWSDDGVAAALNAMATCALNADGSLGAADASPVSGHVIDTRVYPALNRAISASAVAALVAYVLPNFQSMCNGQAVGAIGGMRQMIDAAAGG